MEIICDNRYLFMLGFYIFILLFSYIIAILYNSDNKVPQSMSKTNYSVSLKLSKQLFNNEPPSFVKNFLLNDFNQIFFTINVIFYFGSVLYIQLYTDGVKFQYLSEIDRKIYSPITFGISSLFLTLTISIIYFLLSFFFFSILGINLDIPFKYWIYILIIKTLIPLHMKYLKNCVYGKPIRSIIATFFFFFFISFFASEPFSILFPNLLLLNIEKRFENIFFFRSCAKIIFLLLFFAYPINLIISYALKDFYDNTIEYIERDYSKITSFNNELYVTDKPIPPIQFSIDFEYTSKEIFNLITDLFKHPSTFIKGKIKIVLIKEKIQQIDEYINKLIYAPFFNFVFNKYWFLVLFCVSVIFFIIQYLKSYKQLFSSKVFIIVK